MAMITTVGHNPWPLDIPITDLKSAGLKSPSLIRMKFFTLDDQLVIKKIGSLSNNDKIKVQSMLKQLFNLDDNTINKLGIIPLKNEVKMMKKIKYFRDSCDYRRHKNNPF